MHNKYGYKHEQSPTFATFFQWLSFCVTSANDFQQVPPATVNYKYTWLPPFGELLLLFPIVVAAQLPLSLGKLLALDILTNGCVTNYSFLTSTIGK